MARGLEVECYAGYRADERPLALRHEGRRVAVRQLHDTWHDPDHTYFTLTGEDGLLYTIRHDRAADAWELIRTQRPPGR